MVQNLITYVSESPKTLVVCGWIAFIVGQLLQKHSWLKVALLTVARGLPQYLPTLRIARLLGPVADTQIAPAGVTRSREPG
jgi:hypothetical protein